MIRAFASGTQGMKAQQAAVDVIANNVANVNTTGFASRDVRFQDLLHSSLLEPDAPAYAQTLTGNGVKAAAVSDDMSPGTPAETDQVLDYCPKADGFFAVMGGDGAVSYTRDGSFSVGTEADGRYLVNAKGLSVLGADGVRIAVDADGKPLAVPGIFTFSNAAGLRAAGDGLYEPTASSGAPAVSDEGVRTGCLMGSNVDLAGQMTGLIVSQRGYQLDSRVIQTADQIAEWTNNL